MTVIDRYITGDIFKLFIGVVAILLLVLVGGSFVKLLQLAAEGDISNEVVFNLLGLEILRLADRLIPPSFFLATLFVLGRMYRDNEMTVLATAGIGPGRTYRLVLILAIPLALVTGWLSVVLSPSIFYLTKKIKLEQQDAVLVAAMDAGRFIESNQGDIVLYAESRGETKKSLEHLFIQHRENGKISVVTSNRGEHSRDPETGLRMVTLHEGVRYESRRFGEAEASIIEFGEYSMWLNPTDTGRLKQRYGSWSPGALWADDSLGASAELQERFNYPLSLLAFALLAVPLSRSAPRQGIHGRILIAILVYFFSVGLAEVAGTWMNKGTTPPWMGTWWVPTTMFLVGLLLAARDALAHVRWRGNRPA